MFTCQEEKAALILAASELQLWVFIHTYFYVLGVVSLSEATL